MAARRDALRERGRPRERDEPERGCYGRALREGLVRRPAPGAARRLDAALRVLNVVAWIVLAAFLAWRVLLGRLAESL